MSYAPVTGAVHAAPTAQAIKASIAFQRPPPADLFGEPLPVITLDADLIQILLDRGWLKSRIAGAIGVHPAQVGRILSGQQTASAETHRKLLALVESGALPDDAQAEPTAEIPVNGEISPNGGNSSVTQHLLLSLPAAMREARRWLVWRLEPNPDPEKKPRKIPHYCDGSRRQGTLDTQADWDRLCTFEQMLEALDTGRYTGPGFALGPDDTGNHWQGIDLDHIDERPELARLGENLPGYVEVSPSGTGLHAIGYGAAFKSLGSNQTGIEAYAGGRYFTVTGNAERGDIEDVSDFVVSTLNPLHSPARQAPAPTPRQPAPAQADTDARTIADLRSALASMRSDDYALWVSMGLALKTLGDQGRGLWLEWSQTSDKYDAGDAARRWEGFKPESTSYQAVFAEAQRAGWVNPAKRKSEQKRASVTVCDGESTFLLGRKKGSSGPADDPEEKKSPGEKLSNDPHNRHDRHTLTDDDPGAATDPGGDALALAVALIEDVIRRCGDEPALLASDAFGEAAKLVREKNQGEWFRLRVALKKAKPSGILLGDIDKATRPESEIGEESTTADDLVALVQDQAMLFHSEAGDCFAVLNDTPRQVFKLDTQAFAEWLGYAYYRDTQRETGSGRAASDAAIKTARMVLAGIAKNDGDECPVYLRAARQGEAYYIDLGGDDWRVVEVNAGGWRVWNGSPVSFWRASTTRPLPMPVPGGDLSLLWQYANIPEPARPLVLAWMLESWRPETPFPILELIGQQGTAKSSTQDRIRDCVDPNAVNLRAAPKSVEDLFVSAGCNWLASLNNLSHLSANIQDAICNLATGGGFAGRTLYTNADETLIEAKRPVILNGIVPLVTAQDLTDRVVHIELPEIGGYRSETEIKAAFEKDAPQIVGGLLDLFVQTLAKLPRVRLERPPRMADFALLGEAMMQAQGKPPGSFLALYEANRRQSVARSLEASPVAVAVRDLAEASREPDSKPCFVGNFQQLLSKLETYRRDAEAWPKSHRGLSDVLRRQRPALAQIGILIDIGPHTRQGVSVTIKRKCDDGDGRDDGLKDILREKSFSDSGRAIDGTVEVTI